jgi:hypothetical protein
MKVALALALPFAAIGSLMGWVVLMGGTSTASASPYCVPQSHMQSSEFDQEQLTNAATIISVGRSRNVPPRGWVVAIAAALQESTLRNLPYGDRDSAGLFQMRPSQGWGSFDQVTDPRYAATAFFGGPDVAPSNQGLLDVQGWSRLSITDAAQAVEHSAHPDAYAKWADEAEALVHQLAGEDVDCARQPAADCPPSGLPVEAGLTPDALLVERCAVARFHIRNIGGLATSGHVNGSDHYTGRAVDLMIDDWTTPQGVRLGDRIAEYYVAHADDFGVTYIIWRAHIWTTERPYWRPYSHPDGRTDPTALHMDHLHISVAGDATTSLGKDSQP